MEKSLKKERDAKVNAVPRYNNNRELFPALILKVLGKKSQKEGEGKAEGVCVCVCVCM